MKNNDVNKLYLPFKYVLSYVLLFLSFSVHSQEIGYLGGVNRIGIGPASFQPLYGFSIGYRLGKYMGVETDFFYSQRQRGQIVQADYFSFMLMPKFGYFSERAGLYFAPSFLLNPCLYHSNTENHTYVSSLMSAGFELKVYHKIHADIRFGYDIGLTGAYFDNGAYQKYSGPVIFLGLKADLTCK